MTSSVDVTHGGVVCPNIPLVMLTCIAQGVGLLEWQINDMEIIDADFDYVDLAPLTVHSPPFTAFLDAISSDFSRHAANFTSRLSVNVSDLTSSDQIKCIGDTIIIAMITLNFTLEGMAT